MILRFTIRNHCQVQLKFWYLHHHQFYHLSERSTQFHKRTKMSCIKINHILAATALIVAVMALLAVPMAEGLLQGETQHDEGLRHHPQLLNKKPVGAEAASMHTSGGLRQPQLSNAEPAPGVEATDWSLLDQSPASPPSVKLLTAGKFAVLTKSGVTTTGPTSVTGVMGTSPIAATALTGFGLIADSSNTFSTSTLVSDNIYAADYTSPTPNMLTVAVLDMQAAYVDAAGRLDPDYTEFGAGNIEGATLGRGLYKWGTGVGFTSSLIFNGNATDVWILQIAGDVTVGSGAEVTLIGDAKAENIFWQVAGQTILGTTSHVKGVFLCKTAIIFKTGSRMNGAALAQTAVTMDSAVVVKASVCDKKAGCDPI